MKRGVEGGSDNARVSRASSVFIGYVKLEIYGVDMAKLHIRLKGF